MSLNITSQFSCITDSVWDIFLESVEWFRALAARDILYKPLSRLHGSHGLFSIYGHHLLQNLRLNLLDSVSHGVGSLVAMIVICIEQVPFAEFVQKCGPVFRLLSKFSLGK